MEPNVLVNTLEIRNLLRIVLNLWKTRRGTKAPICIENKGVEADFLRCIQNLM